jgi:hypothetical protein
LANVLLKKPFHGLFQLGRSCASLSSRHWGFLPGTKQKVLFFALLHFSSTYPVLEKWRHIPAPHAGCFSTAC